MQGILGGIFVNRCNNTVPSMIVTKTKLNDLVAVDNGL